MHRKALHLASLALLAGAGCTSGQNLGSSTIKPGSGTPYPFVTPAVGEERTYTETIVDNLNNTIVVGFSDRVTASSSSGGYTALIQSTTGSSTIVNGTNYAVRTETQMFNDSGQEESYSYQSSEGEVTCSFDPHAAGPDFPVRIGQAWNFQYVASCNNGSKSVRYTQQGSVADIELTTVPAGTFNALKMESTLTWTDATGTTRTQTITHWRDVQTLSTVKQQISIVVSGAAPLGGYAVSRTIELASMSAPS